MAAFQLVGSDDSISIIFKRSVLGSPSRIMAVSFVALQSHPRSYPKVKFSPNLGFKASYTEIILGFSGSIFPPPPKRLHGLVSIIPQ